MAIDRDDALRKAEKLLRQGRLDGAIAEYEHVVDAYPDDIATASALGDLYGRAGKAPQAVAQFMRLGDHFLKEGVQAKAAASYRKVIKLDPSHEGALLQLVEASAQQGQLADAKIHLQSAIDKRKARGDQDGADTLAIRLAELDPNDFEARLQAAWIRVRTGKVVTADLLALAQELDSRKRASEAEALLEEVVKRDPGATEVVAAPGQGRARPRRGGARQALPARHARQQGSGAAAHRRQDPAEARQPGGRPRAPRALPGRGAEGGRGSRHARRAPGLAQRALRDRRPPGRPRRRVRRLRQGGAPAAGLPGEGAAPSRGAAAAGRGLRRRRSRGGADRRAAGAGRGLPRRRGTGEGAGHRRGSAPPQSAVVHAQGLAAPRARHARREGPGRDHRRAAVDARRGQLRAG